MGKRKGGKKKSKSVPHAIATACKPAEDDAAAPAPADKEKVSRGKGKRGRLYSTTETERETLGRVRIILADVWSPFRSLEAAVEELEADPAPQQEICFWETLAEAFLDYAGNAILVTPSAPQGSEEVAGIADAEETQEGAAAVDTAAQGADAGAKDNQCRCEAGQQELCKLKDVDMPREAMIDIVRGIMAPAKRAALLSRLFYLSQVGPAECAPTLQRVREKGPDASADDIRDVNLLTSWTSTRERFADKWESAEASAREIIEARRAAGSIEPESESDASVEL